VPLSFLGGAALIASAIGGADTVILLAASTRFIGASSRHPM